MILLLLSLLVFVAIFRWSTADYMSLYHLRGWNRTAQMYEEQKRQIAEKEGEIREVLSLLKGHEKEQRILCEHINKLRKNLSIATQKNRSNPLPLP